MAGRGVDEGRRKLPGSGRADAPRRHPEDTVPGTEKPRWSAERRRILERGCAHTKWTRRSVLHPLGFSRGTKSDYGVPGAAKNTGDDACQLVVPAQAGTQHLRRKRWIPAFAGMTAEDDDATRLTHKSCLRRFAALLAWRRETMIMARERGDGCHQTDDIAADLRNMSRSIPARSSGQTCTRAPSC
jgi:hypothetical protein